MSEHQHEADWQRWVMDRIREHRPEHVKVSVHIAEPIHLRVDGLAGLAELRALVLGGFNELKQEIQTMSGTLTSQLNAAIAAIQADVAAVSAEVSQLLAGVTTGDPITQAQVDALTAIDASLKGIPPAPGGSVTHTAEDTTDTTANGSLKADGVTVRNNFFLAGFDPTKPETT